jgi:helix-turn-helix protein
VSAPASPTAPSPLGEPLLDAAAVAAFLGVDRATVYRLAGAPGGLVVIEIAPRVRRFRPEDVRAFLASRTKSPAMAVEARQLLDSLASQPVELPRLPCRTERPSRPARGGTSRAAAGGR